jgi:hypothetical protein
MSSLIPKSADGQTAGATQLFGSSSMVTGVIKIPFGYSS